MESMKTVAARIAAHNAKPTSSYCGTGWTRIFSREVSACELNDMGPEDVEAITIGWRCSCATEVRY